MLFTASWKFDQQIERQSSFLKADMEAENRKLLTQQNRILGTSLQDMVEDLSKDIRNMASDSALIAFVEKQQMTALDQFVKKKCDAEELDFAFVFDTNGVFQAGCGNFSTAREVEAYYRDSEMFTAFSQEGEIFSLQSLNTVMSADQMKALGFSPAEATGKDFIMSAGMRIHDEFDDPYGTVVAGLVLSRHPAAFQRRLELIGTRTALVAGDTTVVQAGFGSTENDAAGISFDEAELMAILAGEEEGFGVFRAGGENYQGVVSLLPGAVPEQSVFLCTALPQKEIIAAREKMLSYGEQARRSVLVWLGGLIVIFIGVFAFFGKLLAESLAQPIRKALSVSSRMADGGYRSGDRGHRQ